MSSIFSGFFSGSGGSERVGSVRAAFYGNASPDWERLDGRSLARASYPDLSPIFPFNKLVPTARTLATSPGGSGITPIVATANHFVAASVGTATLAIQYSSDGATWSTTATPSATVVSLLATANRFVGIQSGAAQPLVTANLTPSGTWSATSSGPASLTVGNHISRMAYSPSLGRVLAVASTRFTLDDGSTTWVGRTSTSGLATPVGVCWTGNRFICIGAATALCEFSTDGITYTAGALIEATSASLGCIASNGSGLVVVSGSPSGLQVSSDHGATWRIVQIPGIAATDAWRVQYIEDRFCVPTTSGLAFSSNGDDWFLDNTTTQAMAVATGIAKKGTTIVQIQPSTTSAYSFTFSATDFLLPTLRSVMPVASGTPTAGPPLYIKAR
jgi:hypothetical protein